MSRLYQVLDSNQGSQHHKPFMRGAVPGMHVHSCLLWLWFSVLVGFLFATKGITVNIKSPFALTREATSHSRSHTHANVSQS